MRLDVFEETENKAIVCEETESETGRTTVCEETENKATVCEETK